MTDYDWKANMNKHSRIDVNYWEETLQEDIWSECHDCKYLMEDAVVGRDGDDLEYLRCEHYHEIDTDEHSIDERCPNKQQWEE